MIQVRSGDVERVREVLALAGLSECVHAVGTRAGRKTASR